MDDPGYSTSPLDHPLDDEPSQRGPSSLFDLFDHFPPEPNHEQATLAHPNASSSSSFVPPSDILFPPDVPLSQQEHGLMADITLDPDAWLLPFDDDASPDAPLPKPNSPSAPPPPTTLPDPVVVASASSSVSPSPFAPPSRSPRERDTDKHVVVPHASSSGDAEMRVQGTTPRPTLSPVPTPRRTSKTPLFLPSPSESEFPTQQQQRNRKNWDTDPLDVISVTSSSNSPPPLPRKTRKQLMAHVLIPPFPPGTHKSDYAPVEQRLRSAAKGKARARAGDNSGSTELMHVLQNAFESNWFGPGSSSAGRRKKKKKKETRSAKKAEKEVVVVVDDDEDDDEPVTPLDQALANAFTHNSANPNVAAPAVASGSSRRLTTKETRAESPSDSNSVEVVVSSTTKKRARKQATSNRTQNLSPVLPRVSPRRKGKRRLVQTPTTSPRRKRRRVAEEKRRVQDDSDDEVEVIVDTPPLRRGPKPKPQQSQAKHKYRRASTPSPVHTSISVHTSSPTSTPPPPPSQQQPSSPATPNVNSLAGLPLTILPAPSRTAIAIPPRALSHLQTSSSSPPGSSSDSQTQQMQRLAIRQGFRSEGPVTGAHGLLATSPAAVDAAPSVVGGASAYSTTTTADSDVDHHQMHMDLDVPMEVDDDDGMPPLTPTPPPPPPPLTLPTPHPSLRTHDHDHPDGPMLGFVLPEHEDPNANANADADAGTSPERDLNFDLSSLSACGSGGGEAWVDWRADEVLGGTNTSTDNGAGEYAGDGTIDPSVLGGGDTSPSKADDHASSPVHQRRGTDERMDDEEMEDVEGLLFQNASDDDDDFFAPRPGLGKGKGKGRAAIVDGVVESPVSVGSGSAVAGTRRTRKPSWRKALADKVGADSDDESDNDEVHLPAQTVSAPVPVAVKTHRKKIRRQAPLDAPLLLCHHCRCSTRRPKMRCTMVLDAAAGERCRKIFCESCIEKRYPDLTFDQFAETFECPFCRGYCNCSHCAPKRGEKYVSERNGGWRSWIAQHGGPHFLDATATTSASAPATKTKIKTKTKSKARATPATTTTTVTPAAPTTVANTRVFDSSWSATAVFTVTGEPLGNAYLQGNKACIVPLSQTAPVPPAPVPPPPAITTTTTTTAATPATTTTSSTPELEYPVLNQQQQQQRQCVFIGKPLKAWGRQRVSFLDPDPDLPQVVEKKTISKGKGKGKGKGRRGKRTLLFIGNLETLLMARRRRRRRSSVSPPLSDADAGNGVEADEGDGDDSEADADGDTDDGIWPGEFNMATTTAVPIPTIVVTEPEPEPEPERVESRRITPEEVVRAIGAAFAFGASANVD